MNFTLPITKTDMYNTLQEIFHYYRIDREGYAGANFEELKLERMTFTPLTDSELLEKADRILSGQHEREIQDFTDVLNEKIVSANSQKETVLKDKDEQISQATALYADSEKKVEEQAVKNGLINSSIVTEKLAQLENAKNERILDITQIAATKIAELDAQIAEYTDALSKVAEKYSEVHAKEKISKVQELADEQAQVERTVFKYNNSLDEKELKYKNSMLQVGVELKLKFMEVQLAEFTKDELIDMGYYDDVIKCVCGYYDRLSAYDAYEDIKMEQRIMVFLDEYYQDVVYMYSLRASS